MTQIPNVAIVGAGMAGATAARRLADAGFAVRVFDKGRDIGGRMATRLLADRGMTFDHGAQFMRAHGPAFAARVADWRARGVAAPWVGDRFVGVPGMTAPVRDLLAGLPVASRTIIVRIDRDRAGWLLTDGDAAAHGPFAALALAVPAPQAAALLDRGGVASPAIAAATYDPCWSLMLAVDAVPPSAIVEPGDGPIGLIAIESDKPGRPSGRRLVVHATPDWSRAQLEESRDDVAAALTRALGDHLGETLQPSHSSAHRWRYAQVANALGTACLYDPGLHLGAAGDWCLGPRIEAAHESGLALAEAIRTDLGMPR